MIGLTGFKGNGKTTTAKALKKELGGTWEIYSFADPIRDIMREVFGISRKETMDRDLKKEENDFWGMSPRQIMGKVGMLFRYHFHKDFWVWTMKRRLEEKEDDHIIIDDVRFRNEAIWLQEENCEIFGILAHNDSLKSCEKITSRTERQMAEHWEEIVDHEIVNKFNGPDRVAQKILERLEL